MSILGNFWKPKACGQTLLPDRSFLIWQKLVENAQNSKIQMLQFWVIFKHWSKAKDKYGSTAKFNLWKPDIFQAVKE